MAVIHGSSNPSGPVNETTTFAVKCDATGIYISTGQPAIPVTFAASDSATPPVANLAAEGVAVPVNLFELTVAGTLGTTQKNLFFPTTVVATLPAVGSGLAANITSGGAVCGGVFAPDPRWDSVLLEFAEVGGADDTTVVIEIGRLKAAGAVPEVIASVTLTASGNTLAGNSLNPFTGLAHSNVTWTFFDNATLAANLSGLGDVLLANGGGVVDGEKPTLILNCHNGPYFYVLITAQASGTMTNVLCTMTPQS